MGLLNFLQCPLANEQEMEDDRSGLNHKGYSKVAGLLPAFPLPKPKKQLCWGKSQSQDDWFRIQKPQAGTQDCSGILLNFFICMRWLYHIISFFLKPPTHPPPTDDPDSYFIEKIEVIGNELTHLPTTEPVNLVHLYPNTSSSTLREVFFLLQEGIFLHFFSGSRYLLVIRGITCSLTHSCFLWTLTFEYLTIPIII